MTPRWAWVLGVSGAIALIGVTAAALASQVDGASSMSDSRVADARQTAPTSTDLPTPLETTRQEIAQEPIPFDEDSVEDPSLPVGQTEVRVAGQAGVRSVTYLVHVVGGREMSRELISDVVTTPPITQVVAVGTYSAPAPPDPAPKESCDPNYAEACVPIASDVDCAGGSGNGPAYLDGTARVIGKDIYGLDRDGDGLACE